MILCDSIFASIMRGATRIVLGLDTRLHAQLVSSQYILFDSECDKKQAPSGSLGHRPLPPQWSYYAPTYFNLTHLFQLPRSLLHGVLTHAGFAGMAEYQAFVAA